jgi:all-trans-retinol dehydrogenase (NAD+)
MNILKGFQKCLELENNTCVDENTAYNIITVLVVMYILAFLTSPLGVVHLIYIVCKIPYHMAKIFFGWAFPSLIAKDVTNENVLITGGGGGIGSLMAIKFAELGVRNIVLLDINLNALNETKNKLEKLIKSDDTINTKVMIVQTDLSKEETTTKSMNEIISKIGNITILINNAGIVTGKKIVDSPPKLMKLTMAVNIEAHFWTVKAILPSMIENNHGHIVTIASSAGLLGVPGLADYCASKHAAVGFDESIRLEMRHLGCDGVKTTCVNPFFIKTGMFEGAASRYPRLLPLLEPEYAASKIVRAIQCNQEVLIMPLAVHLTPIVRLLPVPIFDQICDWFGVLETMNDFKGRSGKAKKTE